MQLLFSFSAFFLVYTMKQVTSRQCWGFSDMEYEGRIDKTDKTQITCAGTYCLTLSEQGSDFNVYNGTCPDKTAVITDCESRGVGCQSEKVRDVYVKVCCCNSDLCNYSINRSWNISSICIMTVLYFLFTK